VREESLSVYKGRVKDKKKKKIKVRISKRYSNEKYTTMDIIIFLIFLIFFLNKKTQNYTVTYLHGFVIFYLIIIIKINNYVNICIMG
jgi:uncharacterized integral membrane protein